MNAECALPSQIGVDRLPCHAAVGGPVEESSPWRGPDPSGGGERHAGSPRVNPDPGNDRPGGAERTPFVAPWRQAAAENAAPQGPSAEPVGGRGERGHDGSLETERLPFGGEREVRRAGHQRQEESAYRKSHRGGDSILHSYRPRGFRIILL